MKYAVLLFVGLIVGLVCAIPANKNDAKKAATNLGLQKKSCMTDCDLAYKPICAGEGKEKPKSFGSECVLKNHNCEFGKQLVKVSDGECPGGGGVRLS